MTLAHSGFDIPSADCQSCHVPHAGTKNTRGLMLPDAHKPFTDKSCNSCHQGTQPSQLVAEPKSLCLNCHTDFAPEMARAVVHPPVNDSAGCIGCHAPHVGFGKSLQIKDGYKTCLTCHNSSEFTGPIRHQIAFEDCGTCHQPHSADYKSLLDTPDIMGLCMNCHPDVEKSHYHPMGEGVTDPRTNQTLNCVSCHSPHSSEYKSILIADKDRKLCIVCHGVSMH
jgi:predicted CXXCH cytochrome family protein